MKPSLLLALCLFQLSLAGTGKHSVHPDPKMAARKSVAGLIGCHEPKTALDIEFSLGKISDRPDIDSMSLDTASGICGYRLIKGNDSLLIAGALSDTALLSRMDGFFKLK